MVQLSFWKYFQSITGSPGSQHSQTTPQWKGLSYRSDNSKGRMVSLNVSKTLLTFMAGLFIQSEEQSVNRRKMQEMVKIWFEVGEKLELCG